MLAPWLVLAAAAAAAAQAAPPASSSLQVEPRSTVDPATNEVLAGGGPLLTLEAALAEADRRNPDLLVARARLAQAREATRKAWAGYLPQVAASASFTHNDTEAAIPAGVLGPDRIVIQEQDQLAAQVEARQALLAPRLWSAVPAARRGTEAAEASTEAARREVLLGVAEAYTGAVAFLKAVGVQARQLAIARDHEADARVRFEAGAVPKITLLRAEIDRAQAEQDLKRAQNSLASSKVAVATLLDRPDTLFDVEVPPPPAPPAGGDLEAAALRDRPDVRAAERTVAAEEASRGAVRARYLPELGAFGRWQVTNASGFTGSNDAWAVGLEASWSLLDGGLREAELREASARVAEAEASRRRAEVRARDEVRRSSLDLDSATANRAKAEEQVALARENQRLVEASFKAGAATYLEVSDANQALLAAELAVVNESLAEQVAALRLQQAVGSFQAR